MGTSVLRRAPQSGKHTLNTTLWDQVLANGIPGENNSSGLSACRPVKELSCHDQWALLLFAHLMSRPPYGVIWRAIIKQQQMVLTLIQVRCCHEHLTQDISETLAYNAIEYKRVLCKPRHCHALRKHRKASGTKRSKRSDRQYGWKTTSHDMKATDTDNQWSRRDAILKT